MIDIVDVMTFSFGEDTMSLKSESTDGVRMPSVISYSNDSDMFFKGPLIDSIMYANPVDRTEQMNASMRSSVLVTYQDSERFMEGKLLDATMTDTVINGGVVVTGPTVKQYWS